MPHLEAGLENKPISRFDSAAIDSAIGALTAALGNRVVTSRAVREQQIARLTKLRAERDAEQVESPDWHREALDETDRRRKAGHERVVDWNKAKKELRKRFK